MCDSGNPVLPLQQYISELEQASLPRILQVCSGVYFQGSVYEMSGCEVCLSTGDLVKITGLELLSVFCEDIGTNTTFELPINHSGLFKLVPEDLPYSTVEEMVSLLPVGIDACGSFTFVSSQELNIDNFTVFAGTEITLLSVEHVQDGKDYARCQVTGTLEASADVHIPLSCKGEFYECESNRGYSLQEIFLSSRLCKRRFRKTKSKECGGPLLFTPIYQIQGIMHSVYMRKDFVKFPSSLQVDVIDVSEECKDLTFVTPLSVAEVATLAQEDFPTMAEILEGPEGNRFFCCSWFKELQKGRNLVLHGWAKTPMVLACTPRGRKSQRYFLISSSYGGQMRRRAREFTSVYELYMASCHTLGLRVSVTRDCEAVEEEGIPALSIGEQLEVVRLQQTNVSGSTSQASQSVEYLICRRISEDSDDDNDEDEDNQNQEEGSEICLPLFTQAHFVEKLLDKRKCCLAALTKNLPVEVKVVNCDKGLKNDLLEGISALRLEEILEETTVLASLPNCPEQCFEMPVRWLQLSLSFISDLLPWPNGEAPKLHHETIIEVTDHFYHEYQMLTGASMAPPPRPPKRKPSASTSLKTCSKPQPPSKGSLKEEMQKLSVDHTKPLSTKHSPPPPPRPQKTADEPPPIPRKSFSENTMVPNTYVKTPRRTKQSNTASDNSDSDHDYEVVDESLKAAHDSIMSY